MIQLYEFTVLDTTVFFAVHCLNFGILDQYCMFYSFRSVTCFYLHMDVWVPHNIFFGERDILFST